VARGVITGVVTIAAFAAAAAIAFAEGRTRT
jgi:hypothetical protein